MKTPRSVTIERALRDPNLLGSSLGDLTSWSTWLVVLRAAFGSVLNRADRRAFATVAGDRKPPDHKVRELWAILGRRSGKSRMAAAIGAYLGACIDHSSKLAHGEIGMVLVLAPTVAQAQVVFQYLRAFREEVPDPMRTYQISYVR